MFQPMATTSCVSCQEFSATDDKCSQCGRSVHPIEPCSILQNGENEINIRLCALCQCALNVERERKGAKRKLEEQADRMTAASRNRLQPVAVGQNVLIRIPDVDRGRADPLNIMAVVVSESNGFYRLGTKDGLLQRSYCRSEMEPCTQSFFKVQDVPIAKEISLRGAVGAASVSGHGQGMIKCGCMSKERCTSNSCKCRKAGILCNSRCHNSSSCCNK